MESRRGAKPGAAKTHASKDAFEGGKGARLVAISAGNGKQLASHNLNIPPVFDGMIAVSGRLLIALTDGSLVCLTAQAK